MKNYKLAALAALSLLLMAGCTSKSPSPSPGVSPSVSPEPIRPSQTAPPTEAVSASPEPPITPVPSPSEVKVWEPNAGVELSVTVWRQDFSAEGSVVLYADAAVPALSGVPNPVTEYYAQIVESFQRRSEAVSAEAREWQKDGSLTRPCSLEQNFYVECNSGGFISIRRLEMYDSGGLRPEATLMCENFRVSDGKLLSMDDFFTVPRDEYFPVLLEQTIVLLEAREDDLAEGWREDVRALFPFDAFCMTQGGLSLFYPEPSIAPYAVGTVRVDIPWESIEGLWKLP